MKLTANLAKRQLSANRRRVIWTLLGIILSVAMITAVYSFGASGYEAFFGLLDADRVIRINYIKTIVSIAVFFSVIILTATIIVISNAFRVSAQERTEQFGILKSVGATKRQIVETVLYEGLFLSSVGIPLGILVGLLVEFAGVNIANYILVGVSARLLFNVTFGFTVSWVAILAATLVSLATIFLAAWLPALKASRVTAVDAIRGTGEVKLNPRQLKTNWLVQRLFGFEGTLAAKSMKRNRRSFRATVLSLAISIILFMVAMSITTEGTKMNEMIYPEVDATVISVFTGSIAATYDVVYNDGSTETVEQTERLLPSTSADQICTELSSFPGASIVGVGTNANVYKVHLPKDMVSASAEKLFDIFRDSSGGYTLPVYLVSTDSQTYLRLCAQAGVAPGSNILLNCLRTIDEDFMRTEYQPYRFLGQTLVLEAQDDGSSGSLPNLGDASAASAQPNLELTLDGELTPGNIPNEILYYNEFAQFMVLVPEHNCYSYQWFADVEDTLGFEDFAWQTFSELLKPDGDGGYRLNVDNLQALEDTTRAMNNLISTFLYSFVAMLTLIALTNVISTISTNVRLRSREFAMLQSVGMSAAGLRQMLNLESILCALRALLIGLPLGIAGSYLVYRFVMFSMQYDYSFPWLATFVCTGAVFIIIWATTRFAAYRIRGTSIVEAIR